MDTTNLLVSFAAALVILSIVLERGEECALHVWQRTTAEFDELDFLEANTVPLTTSAEALLITLAALLKRLVILPLTVYRAFSEKVWRLSPDARMARMRHTLRSNILLAVASMVAGYPERAALLYIDALRERLNAAELGSELQPN